MKVKRFVDRDSRSVMAKVRAEMGPDAVILLSRNIDGRFEMVAAIDFDEKEFETLVAQPGMTGLGVASVAEQDDALQAPLVQDPVASAAIEQGEVTPAPLEPLEPLAGHHDPVDASSSNQLLDSSLPGIATALADCSLDELQSGLANMREMLVRELSRLPSPNPGPTHEVKPALLNQLLELGLSPSLCDDIVDELKLAARGPDAWSKASRLICGKIGKCEDAAIKEGGIYAFLGSTGVGKTTAVEKLAVNFVEHHGRDEIGLLTTDCYRIGGQEQLGVFAKYLGIQMLVATNHEEIKHALNVFRNKKLVLIDTAGLSQKDVRLQTQCQMLSGTGYDIKHYMVLPATSHTAILNEILEAFSKQPIAGTIITKVDESSSLGGVIEVLLRYQLKLAYIGTGQRVPDDLEYGQPEELLSWAHSLTRKLEDEAANDGQIVKVVG